MDNCGHLVQGEFETAWCVVRGARHAAAGERAEAAAARSDRTAATTAVGSARQGARRRSNARSTVLFALVMATAHERAQGRLI